MCRGVRAAAAAEGALDGQDKQGEGEMGDAITCGQHKTSRRKMLALALRRPVGRAKEREREGKRATYFALIPSKFNCVKLIINQFASRRAMLLLLMFSSWSTISFAQCGTSCEIAEGYSGVHWIDD